MIVERLHRMAALPHYTESVQCYTETLDDRPAIRYAAKSVHYM